MVAVTGAVPVLTAAKEAILPEPLAARPMEGVLFVQLYVMAPPVVGLVKFTAVVKALLQTTWLGTAVTWAVGFTVMVKVVGVPVQAAPPLVYTGVTVMVAVTG